MRTAEGLCESRSHHHPQKFGGRLRLPHPLGHHGEPYLLGGLCLLNDRIQYGGGVPWLAGVCEIPLLIRSTLVWMDFCFALLY